MKISIILLFIISTLLSASEVKMDYWKTQRRGANGAPLREFDQWFKAARDANLEYIRLNTLDLPPNREHFLIGVSEDFKEIDIVDLDLLKEVLNAANRYNIKIILTMFELPGRVYFDIDKRVKDDRLWRDKTYWDQSFEFWKQLASELKDHPAIVAYNLLNEPAPSLIYGHEEPNKKFKKWLKKSRNSAADLNLFNKKMVESIRKVDKETPIVLDGYFYADPTGLPFMDKINDPYILYAFHNPAPWQFATYRINKGRYSYPDSMPEYWNAPGTKWDIDRLKQTLKPVYKFIKKNNIPKYQIIASEVWCDRRVKGCEEYFRDILAIYNNEEWHWGFYAFRNSTAWTGLDFELGKEPMGDNYWHQIENENINPELLKNRGNNPIWDEIQRALKK